MDFIICNEFKWTKVSAVLGLQFGESLKTVACTVDFVGIFKVLHFFFYLNLDAYCCYMFISTTSQTPHVSAFNNIPSFAS